MSHRILVIDHHPQGLRRVVDPLRKAGYEVAVAQTVADGASKFGSFEPALVFIAARLPRTHGTVLCRELKRTDAGANTPIVLVVEGTGVQIDLPPLDQFGADRLIQKPVAADELLALCRELLDGEPEAVTHDRDLSGQAPAEPDDGLSIALEELDALDFDVPKDTAGTKQAPMSSVRLSADVGEEIESHIEGLLSDAGRVAPKPSTGRDHDADAAVIEQLDLEQELKSRRRTDRKPLTKAQAKPPVPAPAATAPEPSPPTKSERPAASIATTDLPSELTTGKFQTEAFTRRDPGQPFPMAAEAKPEGGLARWSWVAIPLTVVIVFVAVFFMARPRQTTSPMAPVAETNPGPTSSTVTDAAVFDPLILTVDSDSPAPDQPEPQPEEQASEVSDSSAPEITVVPVEQPPQRRDPEPRRVAPEPEPERAIIEPARPLVERAPEPRPAAPIVQPESEPEPEPQPEPQPEEPAPEVESQDDPVTEDFPADPIPDESEPTITETIVDEPPVEETAPAVALPEPVTRDAVLIHRVEPTVSKKDLKKGGGTVVLKLRVSESGAVTRVLVERGIPDSPLEAASVAAVLRWRYEPALERDRPVESWTTATFTFDK
ncbi:MAG: TonB family protein [Acidobacteria bacterium]|nr:TonB family protein [Acidobacteriota bacterium]NIM62850.1 TonB family protein [Acidobacteriota bacterium]NIO60480.1 TonB family protein [Acidobacteriota bacterium]NIQ31586.1 TonB family protein [Acidobacteriota bacterium]NIQ86836.1 TonB family protein [Acidobacteriota bacterium]